VERKAREIIDAAGFPKELTFTSFGRHGGATEKESGLTVLQLQEKGHWSLVNAMSLHGNDKAKQVRSSSTSSGGPTKPTRVAPLGPAILPTESHAGNPTAIVRKLHAMSGYAARCDKLVCCAASTSPFGAGAVSILLAMNSASRPTPTNRPEPHVWSHGIPST
jgi:hypothetical protein